MIHSPPEVFTRYEAGDNGWGSEARARFIQVQRFWHCRTTAVKPGQCLEFRARFLFKRLVVNVTLQNQASFFPRVRMGFKDVHRIVMATLRLANCSQGAPRKDLL